MGGQIIKRVLRNKIKGSWSGFIWLRVGTSDGCCEHDNVSRVPLHVGNLTS